MAEVKNSFLASKMNKDLDSRLVPNNQYRNAFNIAVSESEDSDVGALENILGNSLIATATSGFSPTVIGYGVDEVNEKIYLFLTSYTDTSPTNLTNNQQGTNSVSFIVCLDVKNNANTFQTLVTGTFLNFSTTHPIYGVNILEDLLFWTDNRNQPRKININKALNNSLYYSKEDHVSVAKYAPYKSIDLVRETSPGTFEGTMKDVVSPSTIDGAVGYTSTAVISATTIPNFNTTYSTFEVGDTITLNPADITKIPAGTTVQAGSTATSLITNNSVTLDINDVIVVSPNPDYIPNYAGDPVFLQDKYVKFSYRFKFEDDEYSIIAPFTQSAFIPKQDGRFLIGDEEETYTSGEVSFMQNKVNFIELIINFPDNVVGTALNNAFKISEIDIIYQESDSLALLVLDTITLDDITTNHPNDTYYKYNYQSRKPILTLPSSETSRIYDKTPVKALSQEVSGNRIIYGNYVNKHTAPKHLNYQVTASQKIDSGTNYIGLDKEYPESTVKRNRNYQLGVVLMDRYGRQSDVILSNVGSDTTSDTLIESFGASTFYFPYRSQNTLGDVLSDIGNSIKIQFNEQITSTFSPLQYSNPVPTGEPGLYSVNNPLGWYTYKIVVKQNQQEYYNVYTPGVVNGEFNSASANSGFAFTTLISDSLNKVPKELLDASGNQNQFRSDTLLYNVVNTTGAAPNYYNVQGFPGTNNDTVTTISTYTDMGGDLNTDNEAIFQVTTNPFLAKLATPTSLGGIYATDFNFNLTVFETNPFVSSIEIYYETSTTGLISELNTAIAAGGGDSPGGFSSLGYLQFEDQDTAGVGTSTGAADSRFVTNSFTPIDINGIDITDSEITRFEVIDGAGNVRALEINGVPSATDQFELVRSTPPDTYRIRINPLPSPNNGFYFSPTASVNESYTFKFNVRNLGDNASADVNGAVNNSTTITVDNVVEGTAGNFIFAGMEVYNASTLLGVIESILVEDKILNTATFTLSNNVTIANDTALTFKDSLVALQETGGLSNNDPTIDAYTLPNPQYSTMPSPFVTFTGKNGTFNTAKNTLNLNWDFAENQTTLTAPLTYVVTNNPSGSTNATLQIFRNDGTSDSVTLYIDVNTGAFGRLTGSFWSDLDVIVRITDAGGATATTIVNLLTEPGAFTDAFSTAFDI